MSEVLATAATRPDARPAPRRKSRRLPGTLVAGGLIVAASFLVAVAPSLFAPYDPLAFDYMAITQGPTLAHPFGTDNFGRDVLSRVIHAYRIDMQIAVFATLGPFVIGTLIGALVGYAGGLTEALFGRLVDAAVTFPFLVLVIAIVAVLGPGLGNMYVAIGVVGWVFYAKLVAAEVSVQKRLDYADAGRVMGYTPARIVFRHLLPNAITPAVVYWMTDMALAILLGSSLGYLGLGAQPPAAEWGVQIADGKNYLSTAWWISVFPGFAIVLTGLGFSLVGDGLAELLRAKQ
ncbi:ABC transporter permease [Aureimonas leprariae]|uniref:ABC transporter permease n=1 Tax=Plantimonas leprariae TaxID=2615207 RepID=A0A7V7TY77_9HYPH|nr:ABC transporter permease [Aureimonas leprariae]KAB0676817.1 ABC transporter permease [Aureimonas leprariae]